MNLFDIRKEKGQVLLDFDEHLKLVLERRYLDLLNMSRLELEKDARLDGFVHNSDVRLFRLDEICYEEDASRGLHLMNMQNVLSSVKHDDFSVVLIVKGDEEKVSLYYGLARKPSASDDSPDTYSYSDVLNRALQGNFLDISLSPLSGGRCDGAECQDDLVGSIRDMAYVSALTGIPSTRLKDREGPYVQGLERFIDAMQGERYCLMVLAEPISLPQLNEMSRKLFEIGSEIHSQVTATVQKMKGSSDTVNIGLMSSRGTSESDTVGTSASEGLAETLGHNQTETQERATTRTTSSSNAETEGESQTWTFWGSLGALIDKWINIGIGASWASATSKGRSRSVFESLGETLSHSVSNTVSSSLTKSESFTRSIAKTLGSTLSFGAYGGYAHTWTRTTAVSREVLNKSAQDCEALCDAYVNRLRGGKNLGFWNVGIYVMMDKDRRENDLRRAEGLLRAALSGDETHWEPIRTIRLSPEVCKNSLCKFSHPQYSRLLYGEVPAAIDEKASFLGKLRRYAGEDAGGAPGAKEARVAYWLREFSRREGGLWDLLVGLFRRRRNKKVLADILDAPALGKGSKDMQWAWRQLRDSGWGHPFGAVMGGVSTPLNTEELAIVMNLPRHEIQGVSVRQTVPFGVNYRPPREAEKITIGRILVKRALGSSLIYSIPAPLLKKHLFVCGVTGSGKTNTCIRLLRGLRKPFMVIEPAKTEYRQMLARDSDVKVFTLGDERCSPFRINPFAFVRGGSLLTHIDCLKSVFNGAFPMYAAMPYILEEAILEVYLDKGWNLVDSTNRFMKSEQDRDFDYYLPTMKDLYRKIEEVVKRKRYAEEASTNYRASLQARVSSLMVGSKGAMLNTRHSTPLEELLRSKVVIELKNLGDDEEKCFIMGLLLSSIYEYRECQGRLGSELQHILMIEEAHRLLKRTPDYVSPEVGNSRGKAVDAFANMLSEVREYGQGVVIVDQIPTKLASEVIKNTNTKIVHRTLAQDDRLCVGETMNLNEAQTKELALLPVGEAVIYREGMEKAFRVKVDFAKDYEEMISDERCRKAMDSFHKDNKEILGWNKEEVESGWGLKV